jgi:hypothetical protein
MFGGFGRLRRREFHFIGLVRDPDRFEITDEGRGTRRCTSTVISSAWVHEVVTNEPSPPVIFVISSVALAVNGPSPSTAVEERLVRVDELVARQVRLGEGDQIGHNAGA